MSFDCPIRVFGRLYVFECGLIMEFREFAKDAHGNNDTNYCTVASCSVVFGLSYADCYAIFKRHGRKDGHGVPWGTYDKIVRKIAKKQGFKVTQYERTYKNKSYCFMSADGETLVKMRTWDGLTTKNFRDSLKRGDYMLGMRKHVAGVKNGILKDWTAYQTRARKPGTAQARLFKIWKIEKIGEKKKSLADLLSELKS